MTEERLNEYFYIKKEIEALENNIQSLESKKDTKYYEKYSELSQKLKNKVDELIKVSEEIESYINSIESSDIRLIVRLRHISQMTWEEIGNKVYMSPSGVFKKYKKYIKEISAS